MLVAVFCVMKTRIASKTMTTVDKFQADNWSMDEVITRWYKLFNGHILVDKYLAGDGISAPHLTKVEELTEVWRERLHDIQRTKGTGTFYCGNLIIYLT